MSWTPGFSVPFPDEPEEEGGGGGGEGAPTTARYLVTQADSSLSNEVVVGTTPQGELGGTWASPTVDADHGGSTHAASQAAAEATAAAALLAHTTDASDAHDASAISISDAAGDFTATDVEGALAELQTADEALRVFENGEGTTVDASVDGFISVDIADLVPTQAVTLAGHVTKTGARLATALPIPLVTYSNGAFGVGATLTSNTHTSQAWTRSGTTVTVTNTNHLQQRGSIAQITASSDTAALPNGDYVVLDIPTASTFTITGINAGGASGTATLIWSLAQVDFIAPTLGDRLLLKNQAATLQNGLYDYTTAGTGSTPFVLTRAAEADVDADFVDGVSCEVSNGEMNEGSIWTFQGTITIGTTPILWRSASTPTARGADLYLGGNRDRRISFEDFEGFTTATTTTGLYLPNTTTVAFMSGTSAQVTQQNGDAASSVGVAALETGTASSGAVHVQLGIGSSQIVSGGYARWSGKWRTPTVSAVGETFDCWLGLIGVIITADPTSCIAFKLPADGSNILAVTRNSGTPTDTDTGIAQATTYRGGMIVVDPIALAVRFYLQVSGTMTLVATNTTNIPYGLLLGPGALIDKKTGTTMRDLRVDIMSADVPEGRAVFNLM